VSTDGLELISDADIHIKYEFFEKVLTHQSILDGSIELNQVIKINNVEIDGDNRAILFDCNVYNHLYN
jgi:hypothetical protein